MGALFEGFNLRHALLQCISLGLIISSALIIWKALVCVTGSESPVVVVLSGSMEPAFKRGDILFLKLGQTPIDTGEIIIFKIDGRDIPIVHRVIKVHRDAETDKIQLLTKGDNNEGDDIPLYAQGQLWLSQENIVGRAIGYLPYVGYMTIFMTDYPWIKFILIGVLGLLVIFIQE